MAEKPSLALSRSRTIRDQHVRLLEHSATARKAQHSDAAEPLRRRHVIEAPPRWYVSLPTVLETRITVATPPGVTPALGRVLSQLEEEGVRPSDGFHAPGSGQDPPLVLSQEAIWRGLPIELEAIASRDRETPAEVSLALPCHEELAACAEVREADLWRLVDVFADAVDARHGAVLDGEQLNLAQPVDRLGWHERFELHCGLLVPPSVAEVWSPAATPYWTLDRSGLLLVLR